jgi:hypothetical protein
MEIEQKNTKNACVSTWVFKPGECILTALHVLILITRLVFHPPVTNINAVKALP